MRVFENYKIKEHSNMKVGGVAKEYIEVETREELLEAVSQKDNIFIIGNGTNTLFSDDYMDKTFISLKKLNKIEKLDDTRVKVEAGIDFNELVDFTASKDLKGLENLAGIPGSLGGLVYMNGGSYGSEIFDVIEEVEVVDHEKNLKTLKKEEISYTYRGTEIKEKKWIVVSATFKFEKGHDKEKVEELRGKRKENHPLTEPNLGSTFKNPTGEFSARLIIEAGMQGAKVGGASISMKHPNFVVNDGSATAEDIKNLISKVKDKVKDKTGFDLEEEIIIVK